MLLLFLFNIYIHPELFESNNISGIDKSHKRIRDIVKIINITCYLT